MEPQEPKGIWCYLEPFQAIVGEQEPTRDEEPGGAEEKPNGNQEEPRAHGVARRWIKGTIII